MVQVPSPRALELRHLVALAAIGREGSFSRAAESLGYTQSAISQQIASLERSVGHKLLERPGGSGTVSLTAAGRVLVGHADAIVARLASARADLDALAHGEAGVLRVGCYQSVGVRILPRILREFRRAWPRVAVELTEAEDDGELLALVEQGRIDLAFVAAPMPEGPFAHRELLEDPYVVVVAEANPLIHDAPVTLDGLAGVPLVTYAQMREVHSIENRLGHPELIHQIVFRSNDNGTILGLAALGVGAAVISWLSVDPFRAGVRTMPLAGVNPRIVGIAWHRDRYRIAAADAFIELAAREASREQALAAETLSALPSRTIQSRGRAGRPGTPG
ncbi:MAG: LysR family transcriptional regulator [Intrasporangium sp.]|uniref:LysR family transcriptional regulator n=1 Tax=Intrasporangium sp. TaxID=1925024 RepID=UPI002647330A|nr:LysR family transcriptional regulator [Intrasporangium sp.]MDN5798074.1 LysR family transcriptional regulator [Intrasporangium sp.]